MSKTTATVAERNRLEHNFHIDSIGFVRIVDGTFSIQIYEEFLPALTNVEGFSHLQIIWWGHLADSPQNRNCLIAENLFKKGPDRMGVFATRSPIRPNPILVSTIEVIEIDFDNGVIYTSFIDAEDDTPVLDVKPYFAMERVRDCKVPAWCEHWPQWFEDTTVFNWRDEINIQH